MITLAQEEIGTGTLSEYIPHRMMEARLDITLYCLVPEYCEKKEADEIVLDALLAVDRCIEIMKCRTKVHDLKISERKK